ncbi:MAG: hypothetical protein AAFQ95_09515 [Cyanobacteria bacterium J06621_3]
MRQLRAPQGAEKQTVDIPALARTAMEARRDTRLAVTAVSVKVAAKAVTQAAEKNADIPTEVAIN